MKKDSKERTMYFDYLRVFAAFAVMFLHMSAQNWYIVDVNGFEWQVFNFYDSIVRWCVPMFVMISGALFLNREIPLKIMYTKYIFRIAVAYIVWSAVYALYVGKTVFDKILMFGFGHYHMWFVFMIIGLYMCIPFIKPIVENDRKTKYFLLLAFIFAFAIPEFVTLSKDFGSEFVIKVVERINKHVENMNMHMVLGYASYFVLGYYMNKISLSKKQRMWIYVLGLFGFIATIGLDLVVALKTQTPCSNYYEYINVNVLLETLAVFTWFKYREYNNNKINSCVEKLSKYSFGAYLAHALVIEQLNYRVGLNSLSFNPVFSVVCIGIIVFVVSFIISAILHQIPVVKKYIV